MAVGSSAARGECFLGDRFLAAEDVQQDVLITCDTTFS